MDNGKKNYLGTNFLISIYRTENHSLQGVIEWLDTGKKIHFRSEREMLSLIESALSEQIAPNEMRNWNDGKMISVV